MPNIMAVLKQEIVRLARKETRGQTQILKKMSAQYRRDIATLKRQISKVQAQTAVLEKSVLKKLPPAPAAAGAGGSFLRTDFSSTAVWACTLEIWRLSVAMSRRYCADIFFSIWVWPRVSLRARRTISCFSTAMMFGIGSFQTNRNCDYWKSL